jgi:hypothetical protein
MTVPGRLWARGRWIAPVVAAAAVLTVAGCGGGTSAEEATTPPPSPPTGAVPCRTAPAAVVGAIEEGLTVGGGGSLARAAYVAVPVASRISSDWPQWFVVAEINGPGMEGRGEVGVWAIGAKGSGPLMAIDYLAREFSDWGSAAQPGSSAATARDALDQSAADLGVKDCLA